ncbi:MAG: alanine-glyoxylate transaminase/serine-glyoxylate transaminase/serine-pyruvate transaminase [Rhodothermales bacterium]|jgi:alanine-glyoxylate transaminase/serine-glyoxylate transaminase/serine-pyruvate transaminase
MSIPSPLQTSHRVLMGPGPSDADPRVLQAMARPLIGHLDPEFIACMDEIKAMLRSCFQTENAMTFPVSAPGSAGMETCLVNLLEPGDEAVVCINGVFGGRMADIVGRCGATAIRVEAPWGEPIDPAQVAEALAGRSPKLVAIVHAETSTGVLQPLNEISAMAHNAGALMVVDAVTSFCGTDLRIDDWGIDAVYSGSQKCLSAPPGISPVSFSDRALAALAARKTPVQSWFLDLSLVQGYWQEGAKRSYHHTAPVSAMFALHEALRLALEEGLDARFARHRAAHDRLRDGLEDLGFSFTVAPELRLPMLNAVALPEGLDDAATRGRLLNDFNIEVGGGLGKFAGKIWRVGLMGGSADAQHVDALLSALREIC